MEATTEAGPAGHEPPSGATAAAILSATFGLLVLGIVQVATFLNAGFQATVHDIGRAWIPNADGIGPYSGKETLMLVAWLGSWIVLRLTIGRRNVPLRALAGIAFAMLLIAVLLVWPPVWHWLE